MTQEKFVSLTKYLEDLKQRASATEVPARHKDSPKEYKAWLELEIKRTSLRLETDAVVVPKSK